MEVRGETRGPEGGAAPLGLRVLSVGRGIAAAMAVRQLADLGAECSCWEWRDPRPGGWPPGELFREFLQTDIEVVARPASLEEMKGRLADLSPHFDIVITDLDANELSPEHRWAALREENPKGVLANVTDFGLSGPYAGWAADELCAYAMGGYWAIAGDPGREPLRVPGYQAQLHAGLALAVAALAAARAANRDGIGQEVEVSAVEAMLGAHWDVTVAWSHEGTVIERTGSDLFRAKDGYVFFYQVVFFPDLTVLIGRPELAEDPRWTTRDAWLKNAPEFWKIVAEWCTDRTTSEIVEMGQLLRLPVVAMPSIQSLLDDEVLDERGYYRLVGGRKLPGRPVRWSEPWAVPDPGGRLASILNAPKLPSAPLHPRSQGRTISEPLHGVRVLELTNNWAGPLAGRHLADLGAEVIKIERVDLPATRSNFWPGRVQGKYHWNRSGYFNEMNRNKRSVSLNLASETGRNLFLRLVEESDVIIENNSARVMPNLGLAYDVLRKVNPRLVMVSISGFGATGSRRDWVAFGSNVEVAVGLAGLTGYDGTVPYRTGTFVADPIGGTQAALSVLAALDRVERTGRGAHIDLSLVEATLPFMLWGFVHFHQSGTPFNPIGNADPWDAPTGAYLSADEDSWIALAVRTDEEWNRLAELTGINPELGSDRESRLTNRRLIDDSLKDWVRGGAQYERVGQLQDAGIRAAPILKNYQLHADPHLLARDAFVRIDHPDTGSFPYPGFPWRLSETPARIRCHAPRFGEDNTFVFGSLLGLSEEEILALYEEGVSAAVPTAYDHD